MSRRSVRSWPTISSPGVSKVNAEAGPICSKHVANNKETKTEVADEKARVFGDAAIYTTLITDSFIDNKGITTSEIRAVTIVYVRRGGQWKMVQNHESLLKK